MDKNKYVIGLDFGTDSVRALVVNVDNGKEESSDVIYYKRWGDGKYIDSSKNMFRHHPFDYIESLEEVLKRTFKMMPADSGKQVIGIGIDTTGSTPAPVDKDGMLLSLKEEFSENPNAMFILWKDHTSVDEAEIINKKAKSWGGIDYTKYTGGVYSSEWFWSKILHIIKLDEEVREAAYSWIELADWVPALLTGNFNPRQIRRSRCAAGHKAMWNESWGGLPSEEFLNKVDPLLSGLRERLYDHTFTSDCSAGKLTGEWAGKLGLTEGVLVTVGAYDAHMGAVGAQVKEGVLVKVLGTSSCDITVGPKLKREKIITGICGQVDGSVIPGMIGYEAGQSSFGDVYRWYNDILAWPLQAILENTGLLDFKTSKKISEEVENNILKKLEKEAEKINPKDSSLIAIDWLNGRRTPFADQKLKGAIAGISLGSTAPKIYRSLIEATAFGSRAIIERFKEDCLEIKEVIATGGIPKKSSLVMQILADVLDMPVRVVESSQTVALGAAMFAAVSSGYYDTIYEAQKHMSGGFLTTYYPDKEAASVYKKFYILYLELAQSLEDFLRKL